MAVILTNSSIRFIGLGKPRIEAGETGAMVVHPCAFYHSKSNALGRNAALASERLCSMKASSFRWLHDYTLEKELPRHPPTNLGWLRLSNCRS